MNKTFATTLFAAALCASGAALADDTVSETRAIDGRVVKIKLDGVINLTVKQGATASMVVIGEKRKVAQVTTTQNGDTLQIDTHNDKHHTTINFGKSTLRVELTLPALRELNSAGVGSSDISGFSGESVKLALDGAGSLTVNSHYKNVNASLGGVGSMTLNAGDTDSVDLDMRGAGQIVVSGQSKNLHASLGGVGSLDAKKLQADAIDVDMSGLGSATLYARTSANLNLSGLGSATVYGKPAKRNSTAQGLGKVSWE